MVAVTADEPGREEPVSLSRVSFSPLMVRLVVMVTVWLAGMGRRGRRGRGGRSRKLNGYVNLLCPIYSVWFAFVELYTRISVEYLSLTPSQRSTANAFLPGRAEQGKEARQMVSLGHTRFGLNCPTP